MKKPLSISARLKKAQSQELKREILHGWIESWRISQRLLIDQLLYAIDDNDTEKMWFIADQLLAITHKKFTGLKNGIELVYEKSSELCTDFVDN